MGTEVTAPSGLASFFNEPKSSPSFVPVYNSGIVYGPVDSDGKYLFAYGDFSDENDAKFLLVCTYIYLCLLRNKSFTVGTILMKNNVVRLNC